MSIFDALNISASALSAERQRSEVAATNLANVDTTHTAAGKVPFRRREVVLASTGGPQFRALLNNASMSMNASMSTARYQPGSVRLTEVVEDSSAPIQRYDPTHPDADTNGYVSMPNINPTQEMVDLMGAVRNYQLNASAISAGKQLIQQSIDILKS